MGRHAANRSTSGGDGANSARSPLHADLFAQERRAAADFDALVAAHEAALRWYVRRLTDGDDAATESVIKETLYRAAQDPSRYPQNPSAVRPWLVLIARTVLRDGERLAPAGHDDRPAPHRLRPPRPAPSPAAASTMTAPATTALATTAPTMTAPTMTAPATTAPATTAPTTTGPAMTAPTTVARALDDLADVHRDILIDLFYRGTSLEDAADLRGVPVESVKSRLYFAMRALRAVLDQQIAERHDLR